MKKNQLYLVGMFFSMGAALLGCGESATTPEAKVEEARIAMDSRDFDKAISLLGGVLDKDGDGVFTTTGTSTDLQKLTAEDAKEAQLLASASFGRAGIDLISMLDLATSASTKTAKATPARGETPKEEVILVKAALHHVTESLFPSAFAQTTTQPARCTNIDKDFRVISDMIPVILSKRHLEDLEMGLAILDKLVELRGSLSLDDLKESHLLRAIGHFSRIVVAIIVATDLNGNNLPDTLGGVTAELVAKVEESFTKTLDGISLSGILGQVGGTNYNDNVLSKAVQNLKKTMIGSSAETAVTIANLVRFIEEAIINRCPTA